MTAFKRVAVLLGGLSAEREVSLVSGRACAAALREEGFDAVEIDAGHDLAEQLRAAKPDAAFNALHGRWGEDGCVQGLLELMQIPLHAFRRRGLGRRHAQGAREGALPCRRRAAGEKHRR